MSKKETIVSACPLLLVASFFASLATADEQRDRKKDRPDIWLTDLTRCRPADAISRDNRDGRPGTWMAVDYEIEAAKGFMLFAKPGSKAPPLTLPLNARGWHQIRLGIYYGAGGGRLDDRVLLAKLSRDAAFSRFAREDFGDPLRDGHYPEKEIDFTQIAEVFWKAADLTGEDLIFAHPSKGTMSELETNLAYVRLVPMDKAALADWQGELPTAETKILIGNYDGGSFFQWGINQREDFLAEFQAMRDSDFGIVLYAMAYGPNTFYPSKVGEFMRPSGLHGHGQVLHECVANGLNPLAEAMKAAHACGVKIFPQLRIMGPQLPPHHLRADFGGKLMADHPEWLCRHPNDEPIRHLSLAFKEVRHFLVQLLREWVEDYRADGVNVLFSRSFPFVYYEQPVCDRFREKYGEDMRKLPPSDLRVQRVKASFVTQFLREVRAMLDEVGKAQERTLENCYLVPVNNTPAVYYEFGRDSEENYFVKPQTSAVNKSSLAECLFNALDVAAWIREGLVDHLSLHLHVYGGHDGSKMQPRIREITEFAAGTQTKVYADIYPRVMPPKHFRKIAMSYYAAGADGLAFWDTHGRHSRASGWAFIKRLGHRNDLPSWEGKGDDYFRRVPLRKLDGFTVGRIFFRPRDG